MVDLQPIGWRIAQGGLTGRPTGDGVVDRPKIDGNYEAGKAGSKGDLDKTRFGVAVGRSGFVIEEALKKMTDEQRELSALRHTHGTQRGLLVQRERLRIGHGEKTLEAICYGRAA